LTEKITGKIGEQAVQLEWSSQRPAWTDPLVYAPALPGVLVALAGLWLAHRLTLAREQRKALLELCDDVKARADEAAAAASEAWIYEPSPNRIVKVKEAKLLLQRAGIAATHLKRKTVHRSFGVRRYGIPPVDVVGEIAELRRVSTADPFEDPHRAADAGKPEIISITASSIHDRIDRALEDI